VAVIRRLSVADAALLRRLRLAALLDAPDSFASTHAREAGMTEDEWRARLTGERAWFVADEVALAAAQPSWTGVPGRHDLISMWVHPDHRGRGLAVALVGAVVDLARAEGAAEVELWVVDGNDAAAHLYTKCGFAPTGRSQPLPSNPTLIEREWIRSLP
jgi:GNAT superfamily N-acetyltransferase